MDKSLAFEYLMSKVLELVVVSNNDSFTRLKALKYLFFIATVSNQDHSDLLDIFDNFYALPNGPVESDIYNDITSDSLEYYSFINYKYSIKHNLSFDNLDNNIKNRIDNSINLMCSINRAIFTYSAVQLVELSHMWSVWRNSISLAAVFGKGSYPMKVASIRNSSKFYSL